MQLRKGQTDYKLPNDFDRIEQITLKDKTIKYCLIDIRGNYPINIKADRPEYVSVHCGYAGKYIRFYPEPKKQHKVLIKYKPVCLSKEC